MTMSSPPKPTVAETAVLREAIGSVARGEGDVGGLAVFLQRLPRLVPALLAHSETMRESVYAMPAAFEAFIRGGGNVKLYDRVSNELAALYPPHRSLLDVGCGDAHALLPALQKGGVSVLETVLVEPSRTLLTSAEARLARWVPGLQIDSRPMRLDAFLSEIDPEDYWTIAQATFSLQAIPAHERWEQLEKLKRHVGRLLIVEFDVPATPREGDAFFLSLLERYDRAIGEYEETRDLVTHGFLLPMLFGQLDGQANAMNWEHPMRDWVDQLSTVGYEVVEARHISDYFWAPAFLIVAEPRCKG